MRATLLAIILGAVHLGSAVAAPIRGVTATTDGGASGGSSVAHLVDGSGLATYDPSALHAAGTSDNAYLALFASPTITFDLHGSYALAGFAVWNYSAAPVRGAKDVQVLKSDDGVSFTPVLGSPFSFAVGADNLPEPGQAFSLSTTASFIRFQVVSNYGSSITGLNEVMFLDTSPGATVPEPGSLAVLGAGMGVLAVIRRRRANAPA